MTRAQISGVQGFRRRSTVGTGLLLAAPALVAGTLLMTTHLSPLAAPTTLDLRHLEAMAEAHYQLPSGLLARVRAYEGDKDVVRRRPAGLVCGRYQVWAGESWRLCRMARGPAGQWIAAQLLAESRASCYDGRQSDKSEVDGKAVAGLRPRLRCPCEWARWNWGDRTALCLALDGGDA
jgi:hypothetical protein